MRTHLAHRTLRCTATLLLGLALAHCSSLTRGGREAVDNPNTVGVTGNTVAVQGSVQGTVNNGVIVASSMFAIPSMLLPSSCANANFTAYAVGGNLTVLGTGLADSSGNFDLTWTEQVASSAANASEAVLVFDCVAPPLVSPLKCYGHPGDTDLPCDAITNAVVVALQNAVGAPVESSPLYKGLSVAKIVEGLVQTLKLVSQLNPSDNYVAQLQAATSEAAMEAIIQASPVGALFNSIQTLVQQQAAQNLAQNANETTSNLQTVWTPETTIELLVGLGLPVTFNLDANQYHNNGGSGSVQQSLGFYQMNFMDVFTGTTFMAQAARYLSSLYDALYVSPSTAPSVTFLCQANPAQSSGMITYAPEVSGPLLDANNNIVANANALTCLGATAMSLGIATAPGMPGPYNIQAVIGSPYTEADRNDPDGTHTNNYSNINTSVSMVDVFTELQVLIIDPNKCGNYYVPTGDGSPGPGTNWNLLVPCLQQYNGDKYVAGVVGVYRFLTDSQLQGIRVSLDDIYSSLVDGLRLRLVANTGSQYQQCIQIQVTNPPPGQGGGGNCFPSLLLDAMAVDPANPNNEMFYSVCPYPLCLNGQVQHSASNGPVLITQAELDALLDQTRPGFQVMMKDLLNIPTLSTLHTQVFTAAHHVDYNIAGSQYFNVVGHDSTGGYTANSPILCQFADNANNLMRSFVPGTSKVNCTVAQGQWVNGVENANVTPYVDYTGWYALANYGTSTTGLTYYAFVDTYTGNDFTLQGQQFRLVDFSGNPNAAQGLTPGNHLYTSNAPVCNSYINSSGQYQENCSTQVFNYVAVTFPPSFFPPTSYQPFSNSIPMTLINPFNQTTYQTTVQVALDSNSSVVQQIDPSLGPYSVCLAATALGVDPNAPSVVGGSGAPTFNSNTVGSCTSISSAGLFYYPVLTWGNANSQTNYNYNVIRNDGLQMQVWDPNFGTYMPYALPFSALQAAVVGNLGPAAPSTQTLMYNLASPTYNSKFDPFCADSDGDGRCDCLRDLTGDGSFDSNMILNATSTPTDAACNLADLAGHEPTLSQLPLNGYVDPNVVAQFTAFSEACGNLSGFPLQGCAEGNPIFVNLVAGGQNGGQINWTAATFCEGTLTHPVYVVANNMITNPMQAGACGANNAMGPVQLIRIAARNNAYDIARPQSAMKLISSATQNTGTGVSLRPDQNVFAFPDAVSMEFFRLAVMPPDISVYAPSLLNPMGPPSSFAPLSSPAVFTGYNSGGGGGSGPASAILRQFLAKANLIAPL